MNKVLGTAVGVVVAAGVAWAGASWYTGTQVEKELLASIEKTNEKLRTYMPQSGITLALADFKQGVFSSSAHYSLTIPVEAAGGKPARNDEVRIAAYIEHGPFPLAHLKAFNLAPVMATSRLELEKNDTVAAWFDAAKGVPPMSGTISLGYDGDAKGFVKAEPLNYDQNGTALVFSGMTVNLDVTDHGTAGKISGTMESLSLSGKPEEAKGQVKVDLQNLLLDSDMKRVFVGTNVLTIKKLVIAGSEDPPVTISDYSQRLTMDQADNRVSGSLVYDLGMVNVGGRDTAGGQIALSVKNLDVAALKAVNDFYMKVATREMKPDQTPDTVATEAEQREFQAALQTLLAGNPTVTLDPLLIKTAHGESRLTVAVDLAKPSAPTMSFESIVGEMIKTLDARLTLNKPMVTDLLIQSGERRGVTGDAAEKAARSQADLIARVAASSGFGKIEGDNLIATLNYQGGQVDFNGKKMPLEEFAGMVFTLALGGGIPSGMRH